MSNTKSLTVNGNMVEFKLVEGAIVASNGSVMILPIVYGDLYDCYFFASCEEVGVWEWFNQGDPPEYFASLCNNCIEKNNSIKVASFK